MRKLIAVVFVFFVIVGLLANVNERQKCASLRKQGVKAYVAEGLLEDKCVVIQRDITVER